MRIRTETGRSTGTSTSGRPPSRSDNKRRKHRTIKRRNTHTKKKKKEKEKKRNPFRPPRLSFSPPAMAVSTALLGWGWNQVVPFHSTSETESNETFLFFILKKIFWTVVIERSRSASLFQCRSNMNQFIHFPFCFFFGFTERWWYENDEQKRKGNGPLPNPKMLLSDCLGPTANQNTFPGFGKKTRLLKRMNWAWSNFIEE